MSRLKIWWVRRWDDIYILLFFCLCMAMLAIFASLIYSPRAHASACLIIEVPPQAVIWVQDGDTFTVFNFAPGGAVKIRVSNVDTPERKEPKFEAARQFTRDWLSRGKFIVNTCGEYTFERIQATVERDGVTLAQALTDAGLVK